MSQLVFTLHKNAATQVTVVYNRHIEAALGKQLQASLHKQLCVKTTTHLQCQLKSHLYHWDYQSAFAV